MASRTRINLALQGGGAHGAFTWGVLDRMLADDRIEIAAISGTSAGAMNAAAVADGLTQAGRQAARQRLEDFWTGISEMAGTGPWLRGPIEVMTGSWNLDMSPAYWALDTAKHKRIFLHRVPPASTMLEYGASSKFNPEFAFLAHLRDLGRASAEHWLDQTVGKLGQQSTIDFEI